VLVERLRNGEPAAFNALFEKYRQRILAYVVGLCGDRGLAEDITQECFLEMARHARSLDPGRGVSGWLFRTARNRAIDALRRRRFQVLPGDAFFEDENRQEAWGPAEGPAAEMMERETAEALNRAMAAMPDRDREVLSMRFFAGLTFREMSAALHRPLGTVLWQTRRSLEKLRRRLRARP